MTATVHRLQPNVRTHERRRLRREEAKARMIARIGIDPADAPLYDEELRLMAYEESLKPR